MKITQNTEREIVAMLVVVQNIGVKGIIPTSDNIMGRRRENVMWTTKLILAVRFSRDYGGSYVILGSHIGARDNKQGLHCKQMREKESKMTYQYQESLDEDALTRHQA